MDINLILISLSVVGGLGFVLGTILGVANKYLAVEEDPRMEKLLDLLPGYNCGACGKPGCNGMAEALLENSIKVSACKPSKKDQQLAIQKYLKETPGKDGNTIDVKI